MKRRILPAAILLLAAAGGMAWWLDVPQRLGWTEAEAQRLMLYGNVDIRQVQLGFRVNGRLARMLVDEGDPIRAGQLMAVLDDQPYRDTVRMNEAQVAALRAALEKLEAGPREAEIAQARASLEETQADLRNAEQAYERARRLQRSGAVSEANLDQATAARSVAVARVASARESLRLLEEGSRPEDIAQARANLEAAEASLASARTALQDTQLFAPANGVVLSRVREPGAIVSPSDVAYVLSLTEPVWVRTYIAEPLLGKIHPGMDVEVITDSEPDNPYPGQVGYISPVAEFTPKSVESPELRTDLVYRLRVVIDGKAEGLRQGMPVTVRVPGLQREAAE